LIVTVTGTVFTSGGGSGSGGGCNSCSGHVAVGGGSSSGGGIGGRGGDFRRTLRQSLERCGIHPSRVNRVRGGDSGNTQAPALPAARLHWRNRLPGCLPSRRRLVCRLNVAAKYETESKVRQWFVILYLQALNT
jgi:hypothetical protein